MIAAFRSKLHVILEGIVTCIKQILAIQLYKSE